MNTDIPTRERCPQAKAPILFLTAVALLCGCTPAPMPAAAERLGQVLEPDLIERASGLRHALLPPEKVDPADGLTPDEIALLAVVGNPDLRAARDERGIAAAQVIAAGLLPNPRVSAEADLRAGGETRGTVDAYSGAATWSITELLRRVPQRHAASLAARGVALDVAWQEWGVAMRAQLAVYQLLALEAALAVHRSNVEELEQNLHRLRHAFQQHVVTTAQVVGAEAEFYRAQTALVDVQRRIELQRVAINAAMGLTPDAPWQARGELDAPPDTGLTAEGLLDHIEDRRLDLRAMRSAMRGKRAAARAALWRAFPEIELGMSATRDTDTLVLVGPTLQVGIPVFDRGQAERAAARAERMKISDQYVARLNETRRRLAEALAGLRAARRRLEILRRAIESQQRLVDTYKSEVKRGLADVFVYYAARAELVDLRLQEITERMTARRASVELRSQSGYYILPTGGTDSLND